MQAGPCTALRRDPAGGEGAVPFSLPPFAITIYLSLEVEGTRACNWERLVEPEEARVWAQRLPPTQGKETLPRKEGGRGGTPLKGHRAGKGTTQAGGTKEGGGHQRDHFGGPTEDGERGLTSGVPQSRAACVSTAKVLLSGRKGRFRGETEGVGTLGHTSLGPSVRSRVPRRHYSPSKTH